MKTRTARARRAWTTALLAIFSLTLVSPLPAFAQLPLPPLPGSLVVTITSPASGSTVSGTTTVSASVSIVGSLVVAGVQFRLDGADLGAEDTTAPYSISWNTTTTGNGPHTLTAVARDTLGVRFTSDPVTVTVSNDTTPPTVSVTSPASGATVAGTITVSATASDNRGVVGVRFRLDGADLGAEDTTAPYSISWNTTTASNGSHTLTAVARDAAGNRTTSDAVTVTVSNGPAPDTTPPTAAITSPASGATVAGTITVSATASDDVGVAGVQFLVDGAPLGAEDTTAPYSGSWDTTTASDGSHTLTAVARDAAGNRTTSDAVTVTVSNAPAPPPPATVTRFEEGDPSVSFTAGWAQGDSTRAWSGGTAAVSATPGVQATFTFTGPSVSWIGFRGPQIGIARVFLDGVFVTEVDGFSLTEEVRVAVFTATGLANALHTLTIEVTGLKNPAASLPVIVVDAFDVPAPTVTRVQEADPSVTYVGAWAQGDSTRAWSGGTVAYSTRAGEQVTVAFTGTAITWLGLRGPNTGIARVSLDGAFVADVDTFSPTDEIQAAVFTLAGLADASHTLTIEVTGLKNPASTFATIVVDAFDVTSSDTRVQETDPSITYTAEGWIHGNRDKAYSGGTAAESITAGARATFTFTGTAVGWLGFRGPQTGIASVSLDGVFVGEVDTYAPTEGVQATVFRVTGLADASHTLTIEVTGRKNAASTNIWILVDAFDVK